MFLAILIVFAILQETAQLLTPTTIAVITALVAVAFAVIGAVSLKAVDALHANSRIKGLVGALMGAYGVVAPVLSNLPRGWGVALAVVGLILTLTSARIQGPATS
jgi:hypothetical protein